MRLWRRLRAWPYRLMWEAYLTFYPVYPYKSEQDAHDDLSATAEKTWPDW